MPKPIVVFSVGHPSQIEHIQEGIKNIPGFLDDYYFLVKLVPELEEVGIQVFYEKDFNDVKYEELKEIIKTI
jgi:hypothetical protein